MSAWLPALCGLFIGAAAGFAVRHAKLCSFGAIEDVVAGGDSRRLRIFGLALGIAILGTQALIVVGYFNPELSTYVPTALPIAAIAIGGFLSGVYVEYLLPPLLIYLADTAVTLVLRIRRGEVWYMPHRQHVYQRLTDVGLSHVQSATVVTMATVCVSVISLYGLRAAGAGSALAGVGVVLVIVLYLVSPTLVGRVRSRSRSAGA